MNNPSMKMRTIVGYTKKYGRNFVEYCGAEYGFADSEEIRIQYALGAAEGDDLDTLVKCYNDLEHPEHMNTELLNKALLYGNRTNVEYLTKVKGAEYDCRSLANAISSGDISLAQDVLIAQGCGSYVKQSKNTGLDRASTYRHIVERGDVQSLRWCYDHGCMENPRKKQIFESLLKTACKYGHRKLIFWYLADKEMIDSSIVDPAIITAIEYGHDDIATDLCFAFGNNGSEIVRKICEIHGDRGVNLLSWFTEHWAIANEDLDEKKSNPLTVSCHHNTYKITEFILSLCDTCEMIPKGLYEGFVQAISSGSAECAQIILDYATEHNMSIINQNDPKLTRASWEVENFIMHYKLNSDETTAPSKKVLRYMKCYEILARLADPERIASSLNSIWRDGFKLEYLSSCYDFVAYYNLKTVMRNLSIRDDDQYDENNTELLKICTEKSDVCFVLTKSDDYRTLAKLDFMMKATDDESLNKSSYEFKITRPKSHKHEPVMPLEIGDK